MRVASTALPISLSRSSRAALIPSISDPFTTPISIGSPFPIYQVHYDSSMPPVGLTEIFRSEASYFDCILLSCSFREPDQPQFCALFKLTHYRRLSWRPPPQNQRLTHGPFADLVRYPTDRKLA